MSTKEQQKLTNSKGWGAALKEAHEIVVSDFKTKVKTKVKNIIGGMKATPSAIKKTFGKK